jgi:hypothetical protein
MLCCALQVRQLLKAKVTCASPSIFVTWLAYPHASLDGHLLHGTRATARLSNMLNERSIGTAEQSVSY